MSRLRRGYRRSETLFSRLLHCPFLLSPFSLRLHPDGVELSAAEIRQAVQAALAEDIGDGDATTLATVPETATAKAVMHAREPLVVAGLDFAEAAFRGVFEFINRRGELCESKNLKTNQGVVELRPPKQKSKSSGWPKTASVSTAATFC